MQELNETEQKIVDAAAQEFLEKGIAGARTQTIADLAGINKALLHYYFRSKEKLFDIVAERVIRNAMNQVLGNLSDGQDFEQWLQHFVHNYLTIVSGNPMIPRFMLWEVEAGGGRIAHIVKDILKMDKIEDNPLFKIVNHAIENKQIRPIDPIQFIISLIAVCVAPFVARPILEKIIPELNVRSGEFIAQREKAILDLFLNGVRIQHCGAEDNALREKLSDSWLLW